MPPEIRRLLRNSMMPNHNTTAEAGSRQLDNLVSEMIAYSAAHPDLTYYLWCKNCETILGIVTGFNRDWNGKYWDKNDTGCPHCGDNAARLSDGHTLLKRWPALPMPPEIK